VILRAARRVTLLRNWRSDFKEDRMRAAFFSAIDADPADPKVRSGRTGL